MRTYGVNKAFPFVEGIWLFGKSRQNQKKIGKDLFYIISTQHKYHGRYTLSQFNPVEIYSHDRPDALAGRGGTGVVSPHSAYINRFLTSATRHP